MSIERDKRLELAKKKIKELDFHAYSESQMKNNFKRVADALKAIVEVLEELNNGR